MLNIKKEKCPECGELVQKYNLKNHFKNHELEKVKK